MTKQYDNFAGLITFTRASTGTYLDSDGLLKTATTNTPRIEFDINGNRKGILIEEARTNLITYSEDLSNAAWVKNATGTGISPVVTANAVVAPDGTTTAEQIVFNKGAGTTVSDQSNIRQVISTTLVTSHSIWLRADAPVTIVIRNPLNNGTYFQVDVTTAWQRFVFTDPNAPASASVFEFGLRANVGVSIPETATVYAWGAQLEAGSFPTSYISTAGAAASRSSDVAHIPTSAFGYNADKGTVVVDFEAQFGGTINAFPRIWEVGNTSTGVNRTSNYIATSSNVINMFSSANNVVAVDATVKVVTSPASGKLAFAFSDDDFAAVIDGGSPVTDTAGSFTTPSIPRDILKIGGSGNSANSNISGHIKSIQYYPRRLTNAQIVRLTS